MAVGNKGFEELAVEGDVGWGGGVQGWGGRNRG